MWNSAFRLLLSILTPGSPTILFSYIAVLLQLQETPPFYYKYKKLKMLLQFHLWDTGTRWHTFLNLNKHEVWGMWLLLDSPNRASWSWRHTCYTMNDQRIIGIHISQLRLFTYLSTNWFRQAIRKMRLFSLFRWIPLVWLHFVDDKVYNAWLACLERITVFRITITHPHVCCLKQKVMNHTI